MIGTEFAVHGSAEKAKAQVKEIVHACEAARPAAADVWDLRQHDPLDPTAERELGTDRGCFECFFGGAEESALESEPVMSHCRSICDEPPKGIEPLT